MLNPQPIKNPLVNRTRAKKVNLTAMEVIALTTNNVDRTVPAAKAMKAVPTADHTNHAKVVKKAPTRTLTTHTNKSLNTVTTTAATIVEIRSIEVEAVVVVVNIAAAGEATNARIGRKRDLLDNRVDWLKMKKSWKLTRSNLL